MKKLVLIFLVMINISVAFTYVQVGDTGNVGHGEEEVAALVRCINPDFVVNTGDVSYRGGSSNCRGGEDYETTVGAMNMYGAFYPNNFYPTIGNHDYCTRSGADYISYFSHLYSDGKKYYETKVGDVHLFSLDYKYHLDEQKEWLKEKASASNAVHKVVFFHTPPYHVAKRSRDTNMEFDKWQFKELGIHVVYAGHEHTYQRFLIDGLPYFVNGAGGNSDGTMTSATSSGGHNVLVTHHDSHGALVVSSQTGVVTWEFVGTDGEIKDAWPSNSGRDYSACKQDNDVGTTNIVGSASYVPPSISSSSTQGSSGTVASSSYPTCQFCSLLDQAWNKVGYTKVYVPTHGLVPYTQAYPPVTTTSSSSSISGSSTSSSSSSSSGSDTSGGGCIANLGDTDDDHLKAAFLDMTAWAEVGSKGYNTIFGGDYRDCRKGHPQEVISKSGYRSSAYGRYQFLTETAKTYGGATWNTHFCEREQDTAAWRLVEEKRKVTLAEIRAAYLAGDLRPVLDKTAREWASFPYSQAGCSVDPKHCNSQCRKHSNNAQCGSGYSYYGQPTKMADDMFTVFDRCYKVHSGQMKRVLLIGDSQVGGNGGIKTEAMLEDNGYYVDRVGCVGATTTHLLNGGRQCTSGSDEMQSRDDDYTLKPYDSYYDDHDLVILMAGGNEYTSGSVNSELYTKLQSADQCIIVGLIPLARSDEAMVGMYYNDQMSHKGKCTFIDLSENVLREGTHNSAGDPHLNKAGAQVVANLIENSLNPTS